MKIYSLPTAIIAHICCILGTYPTRDVGSLLILSKTIHSEWIASDLLFLALRNQLISRPNFNSQTTPSSSSSSSSTSSSSSPRRSRKTASASPQRKSKRLKISGPELLKSTILKLRRNAERAHDEICGIKYEKGKRPKLTLNSFRNILKKWSPLDANYLRSTGTTILMEVTKLSNKRSSPSQVYKMTQELITHWKVDTNKSHPSSNLSPLMIVAARGYTKVVGLLLENNADTKAIGKGTFFSSVGSVNGKRIRHTGTHTAEAWSKAMQEMEQEAGANRLQIADLIKCQRLLSVKGIADVLYVY